MAASRWSRFGIKTLRSQLRIARRQLAMKEAVMRRHEIGTAYHTRAKREAATHRAHVAEIERELGGRDES